MIIYLHGFASGPRKNSPKLSMLRALGAEVRGEVHWLDARGCYRPEGYPRAADELLSASQPPPAAKLVAMSGMCCNLDICSTASTPQMKEINVREMRESLGRLDEILSETGEVIVSRRGQPIARLLPMPGKRPRPDHADLRARMPRLTKTSEALIRSERDER